MKNREYFLKELRSFSQKNETPLFLCKKENILLQKIQDEIFYQENNQNNFYKYTQINEYVINLIKDDKINANIYNRFDDPYEARAIAQEFFNNLYTCKNISNLNKQYPKLSLTKEEMLKCNSNPKYTSYLLSLKLGTEFSSNGEYDLNKDIKILGHERLYFSCFSSNNQNMLMWSHYANNHKGICLGYDYNDKGYKNLLYPVIYRKDFAECPYEAMLIKSPDWNDQNEWRIVIDEVIHNHLSSKCGVDNFTAISGFKCKNVFLGQRFYNYFNDYYKEFNGNKRLLDTYEEERGDAKKLIDLLLEKDIPTYITKASNTRYELYHEEISKTTLKEWKNL